eukprot:3179833-Pyramimonas_sp.AAC.1
MHLRWELFQRPRGPRIKIPDPRGLRVGARPETIPSPRSAPTRKTLDGPAAGIDLRRDQEL